ncbi:MAG: leucine-rich repeat domain-containing protein [Bacteroidaceae bacterium]|nr:leucine-rich repeat domain-containing protein [Bacteroidaceae bacterium]
MKKLLLAFLSVLMTLSVSAQLRSGTCHEKIQWSYSEAGGQRILTISAVAGSDGRMGDHTITNLPLWTEAVVYENLEDDVVLTASERVKKVVIEEGVTYVGARSFASFTKLVEVQIPSTLEGIGEHAFDGCIKLTTISGTSENVTSVGANAFNNTLVLSNGYLQLGNTLFEAKEATGVLDFTGKGITRIADGAFLKNEKVTSITFDNSLTTIGADAFYGCTNLTTLNLPNTVETFGAGAFSGCTSLNVKGDYRMAGDYVIVAVANKGKAEYTIGDDIIYVAENAFSFATSATTIYCEQTVAPLAGADAFSQAASYYVPDASEASYETNWVLSNETLVNTTSFTMGKTGYATIALRHSAVVPAGLKAYRATIDNGIVALEEVEGKLAAKGGYVLIGDVNQRYEFAPAREVVEDNEPNHMVGVIEDTFLEGEHIYMLSLFNGKVGFRSLKDATYTLTAGKAYLDASLSSNNASSVEFMNFSFGGNTTDIDAVTATQSKARTGIYNVSGQQLSAPRKGMNIVNGKVIYF